MSCVMSHVCRFDLTGSRTASCALRNSLYMMPIGVFAVWVSHFSSFQIYIRLIDQQHFALLFLTADQEPWRIQGWLVEGLASRTESEYYLLLDWWSPLGQDYRQLLSRAAWVECTPIMHNHFFMDRLGQLPGPLPMKLP